MHSLLQRWLARVLAILRAPADVAQLRADLAALQRDNLLLRAEVVELQRRSALLEELGRSLDGMQRRIAIAIGPSLLDAVEVPRAPRLTLVTNDESFARKEV